ncbi:FtsH protease activity modulator HflK [Massilia terrae]|uniref:FtsH protease activity modulator HflK n=1 Tax=Massilia terrae TaxID=1811224 RepID=UPI0027D9369D|nr:FtsH protease activity modulator HflK [Massilia terrae]
MNDPRWGHNPKSDTKAQEGRRPGEGPPDLDQLWRDFNARLNRLFGQRGSGGDGGKLKPDMRGAGITASVIVFIVALIWLASGAFIVQDGQVGVVSTFGKISHIAKPGFNWRWPYPIQAHQLVNTGKINTAEIGYRNNVRNRQPQESLMMTNDQNLVDVQFSVQYQIKDPVAWLFSERDQDETVRDVAESAAREVVGKKDLDYLLYQGRDAVAADVRRITQQLLDRYKLGVQLTTVAMQAVQPPEPVQAAFNDAIKAAEERDRAKAEGEAYANDVIPTAKGKAAVKLQEAEAYRAQVVETAAGSAARFDQVVAQYAKAPAVTRERMYIETMQEIFSNASKVLVDAKTNNTIYLPIDKMMEKTAANDAAIGSKSGPVPVPPQQQGQQAPQPAAQQQAAAPADQAAPAVPESVRQRDARSRESQRERETR